MIAQEKQLITPQRMLQDNYSEAAGQNIERVLELRAKGELMVVWGCSDARLILPDDVYQVRTISATGPRSSWAELLNYERTLGVVVMGHFYCGGIQTRAQLPEAITDEDTASGFVKDHVWVDNLIIQSLLTSSWTASRTRRTVMAAVQDPLNGLVYPQGIFNNGSQIEYKTIPTYKFLPKGYLAEEMYGDKIPMLDSNLIPESSVQVLKRISDKIDNLRSNSPDVFELQSVQDCEVVAVTTNLKALSARFPTLFGKPNTVFQISLRRQSLDDEGELATKDVMEAWRQANYPLSHSFGNRDQKDRAPFKNTRVLYLETGDIRVSLSLAKEAKRKRWVQEWLELSDRIIIAAEAVKGKIQQIEQVV